MIEPDPKPRKKGEGWKIRLVKRFILANPDARPMDVVKATRASLSTVARARRELLEDGKLQVPTGDLMGPATGGTTPKGLEAMQQSDIEDQIRRDVEAAIAAGTARPLTRAERRLRLSAFAEHPKVPTAQKIQALKELEATEDEEKEQLGPGAPLTREDRIHRVSLMIEALLDIDGDDALFEAIVRGSNTGFCNAFEFEWAEKHAKEHPPAPLTGSAKDLVDFITRTDDGDTPGAVHEVVEGGTGEAPAEPAGPPDPEPSGGESV